MKKTACIVLLLLITIFMFGVRKALIIGNSSYPDPKEVLKNAVNDAKAIDATLKKLGFVTTMVTNVDQMSIEEAVYDFSASITPSDEVLFFYSGHGANVDGKNYLIPVGKVIKGEDELEYWAYPANLVLKKLEKAETTIFILDACRNNPFKGVRSMNKGLATMDAKAGSQYIIYSTEVGKTAEDGDSEHSPFTESFIKNIETSYDQIENIMKNVVIEVKNKTQGEQVPWTAGNLSTYFYFNKAPEVMPEERKTVKPQPIVKIGTEYVTGSVKVESDVEGNLFLDDKLLCDVSPAKVVTLDSVAVGEHKLELRSNGYHSERKILIEKNKTINESFVAKSVTSPKPSVSVSGKASVRIDTDLLPIRVWLDGVLNEGLSTGKEIFISAGNHNLKVEYLGKNKDKYEPWQQQIVLMDKEDRIIKPVFVEKTYSLSLISQVNDFQVTVKDASQKMLLIDKYCEPIKLKAGDYHLAASKADYLDYYFDLSVTGNTSERVYLYPRDAVKRFIPSLSIKYPESFRATLSANNQYNLAWSYVKNIDAYLIDYQTHDGNWRNGAFCLKNDVTSWSFSSNEQIDVFRIYCIEGDKISNLKDYVYMPKIDSKENEKTNKPVQDSDNKKIPSVIMIDVPGGSIELGDLKLRVDSFMISKYETTQAEYRDVMGSNLPKTNSSQPGNFITNAAVNLVSWFDAIEYCNRRSILENRTPCYSFQNYGSDPDKWPAEWKKDANNRNMVYCEWDVDGYRLPTETEWMYAAAGGQKTHQYIYSGTDNCGSSKANELGIYNMSSNLSEWCWDIYDGYPMPILDNYHGAKKGTKCVRRGSVTSERSMRILTRSYAKVTKKDQSMGFRICRSADYKR